MSASYLKILCIGGVPRLPSQGPHGRGTSLVTPHFSRLGIVRQLGPVQTRGPEIFQRINKIGVLPHPFSITRHRRCFNRMSYKKGVACIPSRCCPSSVAESCGMRRLQGGHGGTDGQGQYASAPAKGASLGPPVGVNTTVLVFWGRGGVTPSRREAGHSFRAGAVSCWRRAATRVRPRAAQLADSDGSWNGAGAGARAAAIRRPR